MPRPGDGSSASPSGCCLGDRGCGRARPRPAWDRVAAHVDSGDLKITIDKVTALEQAIRALEESGREKHGKVAVSLAAGK